MYENIFSLGNATQASPNRENGPLPLVLRRENAYPCSRYARIQRWLRSVVPRGDVFFAASKLIRSSTSTLTSYLPNLYFIALQFFFCYLASTNSQGVAEILHLPRCYDDAVYLRESTKCRLSNSSAKEKLLIRGGDRFLTGKSRQDETLHLPEYNMFLAHDGQPRACVETGIHQTPRLILMRLLPSN